MEIKECFKEKFGTDKEPFRAYCPYRIAPVGAHSDYQHGLISGFAIDHGVEIYFLPAAILTALPNSQSTHCLSAVMNGAILPKRHLFHSKENSELTRVLSVL